MAILVAILVTRVATYVNYLYLLSWVNSRESFMTTSILETNLQMWLILMINDFDRMIGGFGF